MYAIVDWKGKQYRVEAGQRLSLDRISAEEGTQLELGRVLMVVEEGRVRVGSPTVPSVRVVARVLRHYRGPKGYGFKYKPKKRYARRWGFRRDLTEVLIEGIETQEE